MRQSILPTASVPDIPDEVFPYMNRIETKKIWDSLRSWFVPRGYFLYPQNELEQPKPEGPRMRRLSDLSAKYPYSHVPDPNPIARTCRARGTLYPAMNKDYRDVMIKMVPTDGNEHEVFQHFKDGAFRRDELATLIPALDILPFDERWTFIVLPRWGSICGLLDIGFNNVGCALKFALTILKGLAFMHKNLIAHRDIRPENMLINILTSVDVTDLRKFLDSGRARFALCDFGLSYKFPPGTPPEELVLPIDERDFGTLEYHPPDGLKGELVFDPFAFDVACLGGVFCQLFGHLTTIVPDLAPFLDRMITPDIPARCTAEVALRTLKDLHAKLDPKTLSTRVKCRPFGAWQAKDRWAGLPEEFVRTCAAQMPLVRPQEKSYDLDSGPFLIDHF